MKSFGIRRYFAFFNNKISTRKSSVCCRYNQDGKPLEKELVLKHAESVAKFINGWRFDPTYTRMYRCFYARDYLMAVQFLKDIAKMDALTTRNCPSFTLQGGDFIKVELYSPSIDGLSQVDFRLAMEINNMNFEEYFLVPVEKEKNYRREAKLKLREKESEEMQKKLAEDEGSAKKAPSDDQKAQQQNSNHCC